MKILSKKKYEKLKEDFTQLQLDLNQSKEDNLTYKKQVEYLWDTNREINTTNIKLEYDIADLKKEIQRLKTILTKNNIPYKKENKKDGERN